MSDNDTKFNSLHLRLIWNVNDIKFPYEFSINRTRMLPITNLIAFIEFPFLILRHIYLSLWACFTWHVVCEYMTFGYNYSFGVYQETVP